MCNNQLLDWLENEFIWVFSHIPGVASVMPKIIAKLHAVKDKYVIAAPPVGSNVKVYILILPLVLQISLRVFKFVNYRAIYKLRLFDLGPCICLPPDTIRLIVKFLGTLYFILLPPITSNVSFAFMHSI